MQIYEKYHGSPSYRLLSDPLRAPVELMVSEYYGAEWHVTTFTDMNDFASHPSAILSNGEHSVFVKLSDAANGLDQLEVEIAGLRLLSERAGILTPLPIGIASAGDSVLMVLEGVQTVERSAVQWREIGQTLARIHQTKGQQYGFEKQGYFGPLYQDNRPADDWLTFFIERRMWPRLVGAIDAGHMPTETIRQVERIMMRLGELGIPEVEPCLLHGDAQKNNFISTERGAVAIDPAVYYGNPEIDLAYIDYFEPVPDDVFHGYQEILPIDPGFNDRRELWRIPAYLAFVQVEGPAHLGKLREAIRKYL